MLLSEIFKNAPNIEINQLSSDSRMPMKDAIFFCIQGIKYDGHAFIKEAIDNGAKVIVYEKELKEKYNAIYVKVRNVNDALVLVASKFYNYPQRKVNSYIVSGCYGRCSVATFIRHYLMKVNNTAYIGRFGIKFNDYTLTTNNPTLTLLDNFKYLNDMIKGGVKNIVYEATSSALGNKKLNMIKPNIFVYTNTFIESSEYKENGNDYFKNIRSYLYSFENNSKVILNYDDIAFDEFKNDDLNIISYGCNENADYQIKNIEISKKGIKYNLINKGKVFNVESKLQSMKNVYNLTAAIVSIIEDGNEPLQVIEAMKDVDYIPGTMEVVDDEYHIIVDNCNTIENFKEILEYANSVKNKNRIIGIVGISATDDKKHIKSMMEICEKYLDVLYLTEENSYDMSVTTMLNNARQYLKLNKEILFEYRKTAIESAIEIMNKNDTLLILGMGSKKIMYKGLGKQVYNGDKENAIKFLNKRRGEENEII